MARKPAKVAKKRGGEEKDEGFGFGGNLIVGVIGAICGGVIFSILGLHTTSIIGSLIMATVGAMLFLLLVNWLRKR